MVDDAAGERRVTMMRLKKYEIIVALNLGYVGDSP